MNKNIKIDDCWLYVRTTILAGVTAGVGAVVNKGAVPALLQ